jgi:AI-2 transport protein TqsA
VHGAPVMLHDRLTQTLLALCTAVLVLAALDYASAILAPIAFALFTIAVVWPLQSRLQARLPKLLALAITMAVILAAIALLALLLVWAFSKVGQWLIANAPRFQILYVHATDWLDGHGISIAGPVAEMVNMGWLVRAIQQIGGRLNGFISFLIIAFVFTLLGLLEVDVVQRNIARLENKALAHSMLRAGSDVAAKFQKYILVRSVMSVLTGAVIWAVALAAGLELATAWGVIAFTLNYIPFLGPLVATVFPTLFALAQFESLQLGLVVFLSLNLIQFLIGSYLEPRIAGATLSVSPFLILFAVFFWTFLWGLPGAFIGVPIVIALLAACDEHESTRWIATLLSGRDDPRRQRS